MSAEYEAEMNDEHLVDEGKLEDQHDLELEMDEEEVDPVEVESVIAILDDLLEKVEGEAIYEYLQAAHEGIAALVDWEDDADHTTSEAA